MATIQEYCRKLTTQQLLTVLEEHEGIEDPYSIWLVQLIYQIFEERKKQASPPYS